MKNIIFDIGNVLLSFQPNEFLEQYYPDPIKNDLMAIIFSSQEWIDLDFGHIMINDAILSLSHQHPHYYKEIEFVLSHWTQMLQPIQENVDLLKKLKDRGYQLYILSNFHKEAIETMFHQYQFFKLFDGSVISAYEHTVKPEQKIYEILLQRYHLEACESIFIDDMLSNIKTALHIGIQGIHLPYQANLEKELKQLHIL